MDERPKIALLIPPGRVGDVFTAEALARLERLGRVVRGDGTTDEIAADLPELLLDADVAITGWGAPPIPLELFGPKLRLVAHAAGSVKRLVPAEAVERGVAVSHAAHVIADAVCEYTLALILLGLRRPHEMDAAMRRGGPWREAAFAGARTLAGRPVGVVGAGYVGRRVIRLLEAFGARILVHDPYAADLETLGLEELFAAAEVVTLHAPITPETRRMIGASHLARLRDGGLFVNVARSWLVDQAALLAELRTGRFWAALDVFDQEPLPEDSPFRSLPNVVISPHQAGYTRDTYARQGIETVEEVERHLRGEPLRHRIAPSRFHLMA
ncbi:MAG TPA: hydroxyacid dehydrogenase [Chloroflexota bacterium]